MKYAAIALFIITFIISCKEVDVETPDVIDRGEVAEGHRICFLGDGGDGSQSQYRVAAALEEEDCDQVRYLGDVIYSHGLNSPTDSQFQTKFYKPYQNLLENGVVFTLVMGNHDHHDRGKPESWFEVVEDYHNIRFPNYFFAENFGGLCFINIDTDLYYVSEQRDWIEDTLDDLEGDCKLSIAMGHHPYKSIGKHGNANPLRKPFLEKLVGKIDAYFAGHDHNLSYEGVHRGTNLFVSGAAGKLRPLVRQPQEGNFGLSALGYVVVTIHDPKGDMWADYEYRAIVDDEVKTVFTGEFEGRGIR